MDKYEVKAVKSWSARDGIGTTCNLYRYGQKVAECRDDGNGGEWEIRWLDRGSETSVAVDIKLYDGTMRRVAMTQEQALFHEHCKGRFYPPEMMPDGVEPMPMGMGGVIAEMCDEWETKRREKQSGRAS